MAEDGIVELVVNFSLRIGFSDDAAQISLQGENLTAEMMTSSNMGKELFRVGCCQGRDARFVLPLRIVWIWF